MSHLGNAVVVVTGGAQGIGRALALEAARLGARVMVLDIEDASVTVTAVRAAGGIADSLIADVADVASVQLAAKTTVDRFGEVNVVCSNAGAAAVGSLQDTAPDDAKRVIRTNVEGTFNVIHSFAPALMAAAAAGRPAHLMSTGSEQSLGVPPHVPAFSVYTACKYALLGFVDTARRDLEPAGVAVSLLAPGWALTEAVQQAIDTDADMAAVIKPYAQTTTEIAGLAFAGMLAGTHVIVTNPHTRSFAMDHARDLMRDIQELPCP